MELAAREAIEAYLPEGMITVGTRVDVRHQAAALLGTQVWAKARLMAIKGRRLLFDVRAFDRLGVLASGENEQLMVRQQAFLDRVHRRSA